MKINKVVFILLAGALGVIIDEWCMSFGAPEFLGMTVFIIGQALGAVTTAAQSNNE